MPYFMMNAYRYLKQKLNFRRRSNAFFTAFQRKYYKLRGKAMLIVKTKFATKTTFITPEVMQTLPFQSFRKVAFLRARPLTEKDYLHGNGIIFTKEGRVPFEVGDYLACGISDEEWPIPKSFLATNYKCVSEPDAEGFSSYRSLGTRQALQMRTKFAIQHGEDSILTGNPGDYLVRSGDKVWITEGNIFENSYRRV